MKVDHLKITIVLEDEEERRHLKNALEVFERFAADIMHTGVFGEIFQIVGIDNKGDVARHSEFIARLNSKL